MNNKDVSGILIVIGSGYSVFFKNLKPVYRRNFKKLTAIFIAENRIVSGADVPKH